LSSATPNTKTPRRSPTVNDARAIGEALERLGLAVHLRRPRADELLGALDAFAADLIGRGGDLHYSGHGADRRTNYLLPVTSK
jgi:hypothetical protein